MMASTATLLILGLVLCLLSVCTAEPSLKNTSRQGPRNLILGRCVGRGRASRLCRRKRNGFCRPVRCREGSRRGFRCRCRPIPSPSAINIAPNEPCDPDAANKCTNGFSCSCGGRCRRDVSLTIDVAGDDSLRVFTCGRRIGATPSFSKLQRIRYTGPCDNIIVEATNDMLPDDRRNPVAAALLVKMGEMSWGSLSDVAGVRSLEGVGTFMPGSGFELNSEAFDYSGWTPLVRVTLISRAGNFMRLANEGALPVCTADETVAPGVYGFRFDAPYC